MVILSVDYGDARTGIAVCDRMEILASPVCVINESYEPKVISAVAAEAQRQKAELIVVGLPKNMDGTEGDRAIATREFGNQLISAIGGNIDIEYLDERLTSVTAEEILIEAGVRREKRKEVIDKLSATLILQDYLDRKK